MLVVARHGETEANVAGLLLGRADIPLTEEGRRQAAALGAALAGAAVVVSSPLARCLETAACFDAPVEVDDRWVELDYGEYDRQPFSRVPGSLWTRWRVDPTFRPPGGESLVEVGERVRAACEDLSTRAVDADVVVVTHVSPIKAAVAWALGVGDEVSWRMFVGLASVTRIAIGDRGPVLTSFNESDHLLR